MRHTKFNSSRLLQYSVLSAGFIYLKPANSQTIYTDIDPDEIMYQYPNEDEGWKYLDFNDDDINDAGLHFEVVYNCGYCPYLTFFEVALTGANEIATITAAGSWLTSAYGSYASTGCYFPPREVGDVFADGDTIGLSQQWGKITELFETNMCGYWGGVGFQGYFFFNGYGSEASQFLTFKTYAEDTSYCWVRLQWNDEILKLKDYACSDDPSFVIKDKVADFASNIQLTNNDTCTGKPDEYHLSFEKARNENTVLEYRVFISNYYTLDIDNAVNVENDNYIRILPNGENIELDLPPDMRDYAGNVLIGNSDIKYYAYVYSVPNPPMSTEGSVTRSAGKTFGAGICDAPNTLSMSPEGDAGTSADLEITCNGSADETTSTEYRLMMLTNDEKPDFSLDDAQSATAANYISLAPGAFSLFLPEGFTTWNGDTMLPGIDYRAVVLAIHKEPEFCADKLSGFSSSRNFGDEITGITDESNKINYFNYNNGILQIELSEFINAELTIYTLNGEKIIDLPLSGQSFDLPFNFASGIYVCSFLGNQLNATLKIIVIN